MKAKIDNSKKLFSNFVQAIKAITDECIFFISETGISVSAVDPSNSEMISFDLGAVAFIEFEATEEKGYIDISKMSSLIDTLDGELALKLTAETLLFSSGKQRYEMRQLTPDSVRRPPKIPSFDGVTELQMSGQEFKEMIDTVSKVSNYVVFTVKEGKFAAESYDSMDTASYEFPGSCDIRGQDVKVLFGIDFLQSKVKVLKGLESIKFFLRTDHPLKICFSLGEGANGYYLIAPRVGRG